MRKEFLVAFDRPEGLSMNLLTELPCMASYGFDTYVAKFLGMTNEEIERRHISVLALSKEPDDEIRRILEKYRCSIICSSYPLDNFPRAPK